MIPIYLFQRNSRSWKKLKKYLALVVEILRLVVTRCTESNSQPKPLFGDLNIKLMFQYTPFKLKHHALSIHLQSLMHTIKLPKFLLFGLLWLFFLKIQTSFCSLFLGVKSTMIFDRSITWWPRKDLPYLSKTSNRYLLTILRIFPYFHTLRLGNRIMTTLPTLIEGSSWKLLLPGLVRFPATSSSTKIVQICLKTASFCSKSSSKISNCSAELIRGWSTSLMLTSPVSLAKIGREFSKPAILVRIRSNSNILPNGCNGCFLILLIDDRSIVLINLIWLSMVPDLCWLSVGAR